MTHAESSAGETCLGAEETRDPHPHLVRLGTFLFKRRKYVLTPTFLAVALCGRPRQLFGSATWDVALDAAGIAVALCGQSLRAAVIGLAYIKRGGKSGTIHADTLVQRGLFAHSTRAGKYFLFPVNAIAPFTPARQSPARRGLSYCRRRASRGIG